MSGLLAGKIAVITGAGHGIGAATAELFAQHGATVYATDIDGPAVQSVAKSIGEGAIPVSVDVRDPGALVALRDQVIAEHGRSDVLVNNAGHWVKVQGLLDGDEHWQELYEINLLHVMRATRLFLPAMIQRGHGVIVNVSSIEGVRGYPVDPVYAAFKAAVIQFTRSAGVDAARFGVRINGVAPDLTNSEQSNFKAWDSPSVAQRWPSYLPLGRMGEPVDQARVILFLASELSGFVVGQTINADGGTAEAGGWYPSSRRPGRSWTNRPFDA
ncbi:MAG TPA: SDR family oxidoreductase [Frankiaceae bacterium]|jgi:NAD(P)-dependent dehydrogenase (short-subunit alcohol dehydrogenase family)|nr:SDR family oxidoreductase [Frankiaceae bacterium]